MKRIAFISLLAILSLGAMAQTTAKAVLDKTSSVIRNAGDIKADFTASSSAGSMTGTIYIHGKQLHLSSANIMCWFDGKTLWTLNKQSNEVNITTPSAAEKQAINPYNFIEMYKSGYNYTMRETKSTGKACYEVTLTATAKSNKIQKMIVMVDKSTYYPLSVAMQKGKGTTIISISNCKTKQKFSANTFKFNQAAYKDAEIIDLR